MKKALIHNFDYPFWHLGGQFFHYSECNSELRNSSNVRVIAEDRENKNKIISDFFNALLTNDKICLNLDSLLRLIPLLGFEDTLKLLRRDIFEIIYDGSYHPGIINKDNGLSEFAYVCSLQTALGIEQDLSEALESTLKFAFDSKNCRVHLRSDEINHLQLLIEKNIIKFDSNLIQNLISDELKYDIQNKNLVSRFRIISHTIDKIHDDDIYRILRLAELNRGLAYASQINATNLIIESAALQILNTKFSPTTKQTLVSGTTKFFERIVSTKGIPDLGKLYLNKIISLEDILDIRDDFDGRLFRNWLDNSDYNEERTFQYVLNKLQPTLRDTVVKLFRWTYPTVIGFVQPITGIATSLADSFLVDKISQGWHPSIFLDDKLKANLDNRLKEFQKDRLKEKVRNSFPYISQNQYCPCGSGKKYKSCCGKFKGAKRGFGKK